MHGEILDEEFKPPRAPVSSCEMIVIIDDLIGFSSPHNLWYLIVNTLMLWVIARLGGPSLRRLSCDKQYFSMTAIYGYLRRVGSLQGQGHRQDWRSCKWMKRRYTHTRMHTNTYTYSLEENTCCSSKHLLQLFCIICVLGETVHCLGKNELLRV